MSEKTSSCTPFLFDLSPSLSHHWKCELDFVDKSMIANEIPIRTMEVPCAMKGKKKKKVKKERKEEEVESRRWEGSAGKDERQQKETSTTVWWVFVPIESPSFFLSLFLYFFPLSSSLHLSKSVSRTGTVAGLSGTGLDQLLFFLPSSIFLSVVRLMR